MASSRYKLVDAGIPGVCSRIQPMDVVQGPQDPVCSRQCTVAWNGIESSVKERNIHAAIEDYDTGILANICNHRRRFRQRQGIAAAEDLDNLADLTLAGGLLYRNPDRCRCGGWEPKRFHSVQKLHVARGSFQIDESGVARDAMPAATLDVHVGT